jgi:hypothetical protein
MKLQQLQPGDKTRLVGGQEAILVAIVSPHPLWPQLWMPIWWVLSNRPYWSHDALSPLQDVGEIVEPRDKQTQQDRLRSVLVNDKAAAMRVMNSETLGA